MTALLEPIARKQNEFTTPAALQALLKANLGYNSRQVTARKTHSLTWLEIIIRDPKVDIAKVKAFAAPFDTSHTDVTDYHSGQSVRVETTKEVDDAHAALFMEEIKAAIAKAYETKAILIPLSTGARLMYTEAEFWVSRKDGPRGAGIRYGDVNRYAWAVRALALQAARI